MTLVAVRGGASQPAADDAKPPAAIARYGRLAVMPLITLGLMALTLLVRAINIAQYPGVFIDEGTYIRQAWAVQELGRLSPGYYWADHLPGGWTQLAMWFGLTDALERNVAFNTMAGREFMVFCAMATAGLLYLLSRRLLKLTLADRPVVTEVFAALASLLWIVSPLANAYSRMTLLDNIMVPWILGAMLLVLGPTRHLRYVVMAGLCVAVAYLTKEISLLAVPAVAFMVWQHFRGTPLARKANIRFWAVAAGAGALFPAYMVVTGEGGTLWRGQVMYHMVNRPGTGSLWDPSSQLHYQVMMSWLPLDYWLPLAGLAAIPLALMVRQLRGPAILLVTHVVLMLFAGVYIPAMYIVILLPYFALLVACLCAVACPTRAGLRAEGRMRQRAVAGAALLAVMAGVFVFGGGVRDWYDRHNYQSIARDAEMQHQAVAWARQNLTPNDFVLVENQLWLDIVQAGVPQSRVITAYNYMQEMTEAERQQVTHAIMGEYVLRPDQDTADGAISGLRERSRVVVELGKAGDYRQMFILEAAAAVPTG